jgi:FkbM family methyltransferase
MLIKVSELTKYFGIFPKTILHIGAHTAEEKSDYEINGWGSLGIIWVEAQEDLCETIPIRQKTNDKVLNCLAWNQNGQDLKFKITNNGQSSSILDFGTHKQTYQNINFIAETTLKSVRLDSLLNENDNFDLINIDVQGVEKEALEGLGSLITKANYIYSEVNKEQVYQNCTIVKDLDLFLNQFGFKRVVTKWVQGAGWGDALYIMSPNTKYLIFGKYLTLKFLYFHIRDIVKSKLILKT